MHYVKRRMAFALMATILTAAIVAVAFGWLLFSPMPTTYGVTFSTKYAKELGLDWREAYQQTLDDLGVRVLRVPVYWYDVEHEHDRMEFDDIDWMMDEASRRGALVTLAIGMKVPRWPECNLPAWTSGLEDEEFTQEVVEFVRVTAGRYAKHPALARWQVENEPLFWYGECPLPDLDRLRREVEAVRAADPSHPILMTSSGEQAAWTELASLADVVGVSLYRFAWNPTLGPVVFPHSPLYYRVQRALLGLFGKDVVITELQMEPWFEDGIGNDNGTTIPFTADDFYEHLRYANETGVSEIWLWGVEWWYREHTRGRSGLWHAARDLFGT